MGGRGPTSPRRSHGLLQTPWPRTLKRGFKPLERRLARAAASGRTDVPGQQLSSVAYFSTAGLYTALWFVASVGIGFSNKYFVYEKMGFNYPFLLTFITNAGVAICARILTLLPKMQQLPVPWRPYLRVVVPLGISSFLDVGFSNWSLLYLDVSFHVIIKGAAPLFVLLCGLAIGVERGSRQMPLAILLISTGLCLVGGDRLLLPDRPIGIILGVISLVFTGLRWALTQLLLRGAAANPDAGSTSQDSGKPHPLATMRSSAPVIACSAFVGVCAVERGAFAAFYERTTSDAAAPFLAYFLCNIALVFTLILAEYRLVLLTSSLTVSVLGVAKELVTVMIAVVAGERFSALNGLGLVLCLAGDVVYFMKRTREKQQPEEEQPVFDRARTLSSVGPVLEKEC